MLRRRVFPIAAAVAAVSALCGCSPVIRDARFRSIELTPVSQTEVETVADLQVVGTKKVIGVVKGIVTSPEQKQSLYVEALELALASDPSDADVLVAPSYYEVTQDKVSVTVTVMGYPARYKNFRLGEKPPFSVRQLPGGVAVVSYNKNSCTAKLASDNVVVIQPIKNEARANTVPAAPQAAAGDVVLPVVGGAGKADAPAATSTSARTGE